MLSIGIQPRVLATAPELEACLEGWATLRVDPDLRHCEAVILRSDTRVDERFISARPSLKWVTSATSGHDHIDGAALARHGVLWTSSPGCNAEAVADWCVIALERLWKDPPSTAGIIGVGHVGRAVCRRLERMGWRVLMNDPPRAARESGFQQRPIGELLQRCDLVTLHVPLDESTRGLFNASAFASLKPGALLLNAARGGVMDETAALAWMRQGGSLAIDVFAGEPHPNPLLIQHAALATPHIAGHTAWAKAEGVRRCLQWLAEQHRAEPPHDAVGVAPCNLEPRRALLQAHQRLKRGESFKAVRSSSVRLRLPDP